MKMLKKMSEKLFGKEKQTAFDSLGMFDRMLGEQARDTQTWRCLAILFAMTTFLSIGVNIWALRQPKSVPVLITMADWGEAKFVGRADKLSYQGIKIPDIAIQYQLRRFVINTFSIPQDYEVLKSNLSDCYACVTPDCSNAYSNYLKSDTNPLKEYKQHIFKRCEVETILKLENSKSYQVDFVVSQINERNVLLRKMRMRAVCGVDFFEPPAKEMIKNPLGIYITNFDFSEIGEAK